MNSETSSEKMATMSAIKDFTAEELCEFLSSYDLSEGAVDNFRTNRICGTTLFEFDLKELLPLLGDRKQIQRILSSYQPTVSVSYNVTSYVARFHFMQLPTTPLPTSAAVAHAGTSWISSCIPDTFSRRTREGIAKGLVTRGQRIEKYRRKGAGTLPSPTSSSIPNEPTPTPGEMLETDSQVDTTYDDDLQKLKESDQSQAPKFLRNSSLFLLLIQVCALSISHRK